MADDGPGGFADALSADFDDDEGVAQRQSGRRVERDLGERAGRDRAKPAASSSSSSAPASKERVDPRLRTASLMFSFVDTPKNLQSDKDNGRRHYLTRCGERQSATSTQERLVEARFGAKPDELSNVFITEARCTWYNNGFRNPLSLTLEGAPGGAVRYHDGAQMGALLDGLGKGTLRGVASRLCPDTRTEDYQEALETYRGSTVKSVEREITPHGKSTVTIPDDGAVAIALAKHAQKWHLTEKQLKSVDGRYTVDKDIATEAKNIALRAISACPQQDLNKLQIEVAPANGDGDWVTPVYDTHEGPLKDKPTELLCRIEFAYLPNEAPAAASSASASSSSASSSSKPAKVGKRAARAEEDYSDDEGMSAESAPRRRARDREYEDDADQVYEDDDGDRKRRAKRRD
jgi:hypothetical protein